MKNIWKWILGIAALSVVLFVLPFFFRGASTYGMMNSGWHRPMMGGYGYLPFSGFLMGFGMLLMWGIPVGLIILAIVGVARLTSQPNEHVNPPASSISPNKACPHCDKIVQEDWKNCPYCGSGL